MSTRPSPAVHLNLNVRSLKPSATLAINERSNALRAHGRTVHKLGLGQSPFPVPDEVVASLREHAGEKDYLPVKGLPALRQSIAAYLKRTQGLAFSGDDVLIGPGSKELMFILQLTYYGDLIIPSPSWVSYAPQARIIGRNLSWLPTRIETGLGVEPDTLRAVCEEDPERPRLLILNYPGNPSGMCYSDQQLQEIADVAREYRMVLLSDEIYGGLRFDGEHTSVARYYPEGTIISTGLSKWCGAGGWRLGAFVFPEELRWLLNGMAVVASETFTSTSAPIQYAAVTAFDGSPAIEQYLDDSRRILQALGSAYAERLRDCGAELADPQGAFYLFPKFEAVRQRFADRGIHDSASFCERLLEEAGVATLPGADFGRPPGELSFRLAYVNFDGNAALNAAREHRGVIDAAFLDEHCAPAMDALDALCNWLQKQ